MVAFDEKVLQVSASKQVDINILNYEVKLIDWNWKLVDYSDPLSILVTSPATHQKIKVNMHFKKLLFITCN